MNKLIIAIIGRLNVGKSTLFNVLTNNQNSIITKIPGTTRDRKYVFTKIHKKKILLIDTGGLQPNSKNKIQHEINNQTILAIQESNLILFIVDAKSGVISEDYSIKMLIKKLKKETILIINKIENLDQEIIKSEFSVLGFKEKFLISSLHKVGITKLLNQKIIPWINKNKFYENNDEKTINKVFNNQQKQEHQIKKKDLKITIGIIGRPNVGKSTFINNMLKKKRIITGITPGTTRDNISVPIINNKKKYILIDTAGIYKKNKINQNEINELLSIKKTFKTINISNVLIFIIDSTEIVTKQDLKLLQFTQKLLKPTIILINKWDLIRNAEKKIIKQSIYFKLKHLSNFIIHFISALNLTNRRKILNICYTMYKSSTQKINSAKLTKIMYSAIKEHSPPLFQGKKIKLNFAHPGGFNPLKIIIHGNRLDKLLISYKKYLIHYFQKSLNIKNTNIIIYYKNNKNPFI